MFAPFRDYLLERQPAAPPIAGAEVYRRLTRANLESVIENAFPVSLELVGQETFDDIVAAFLEAGGPSTPLYRDVPGDFVTWALESQLEIVDLLHFEWLELVAERHPADLERLQTSSNARVVTNPTMQVGVYLRPVHLIRAGEPWPEPFSTPMAYLVWRDPEGEVRTRRVGLLIARALAVVSKRPLTRAALLRQLAKENPGVDAKEVGERLTAAFAELYAEGGLLAEGK